MITARNLLCLGSAHSPKNAFPENIFGMCCTAQRERYRAVNV